MDYYDKMIDDKKKTISFLKEYLEDCQKKVKSLKRETELIKEDLELVQFEMIITRLLKRLKLLKMYLTFIL